LWTRYEKIQPILHDLELKDLIDRNEMSLGKLTVSIYKPTQKGIEFCKSILEPYEKMFPRSSSSKNINNNKITAQGGSNNKELSILLLILI
jgi:DNA-binding PadR family transcriptional regulator